MPDPLSDLQRLGQEFDAEVVEADWVERTRARVLHNTDPVVVAEHLTRMKAWAARIGTPKRCKVGEVHPASGECLHCGAANGQHCLLGFGG